MVLMNWAIDVPQTLLQSDAKTYYPYEAFLSGGALKEQLIIKESVHLNQMTDCRLQFGGMKKEFRVIVDHYATVKLAFVMN